MRHLLGVAVTAGTLLLVSQGEPVSAQKVMTDGIKDLATQIATNVAKEQKRKIAILPFRELDGKPTVLGTYISEELVTDLFASGGLSIVERSMLDRLLGEIRLSQTGLIDPDTAKRLGKIAGVDAIVTGTITDLQSYVALNCRLIDAQTGSIFSVAQTKIVKDDDLRKIMGVPLSTEASKNQEEPIRAGSTQETEGNQSEQQQEIDGFLFELKRCMLSGNAVSCDLLITNKRDDRTLTIVSYEDSAGRKSRLIGGDGTEFKATEVSLGASKGQYVESILASNVPIKAKIGYAVSPDIRKAALIEVLAAGGGTIMVQFRNVALKRP
jgi:curli biogenesis system outer membrane secretion channel CsgG